MRDAFIDVDVNVHSRLLQVPAQLEISLTLKTAELSATVSGLEERRDEAIGGAARCNILRTLRCFFNLQRRRRV